MESIVALAGRRIDLPSAHPERFPARNIERVQRAIQLELENHRASWLVSSAAAGADLIGIKAAVALGVDCRIVLFTGVREFAHKSVKDRGHYWEEEFKRLLAATKPENVILVPEQATDSETFNAVNERILGEAVALATLRSSLTISIAAWDGIPKKDKDGEGEDFTVHFIERANAMHIPVFKVSTL
jgi:hypothetical protein